MLILTSFVMHGIIALIIYQMFSLARDWSKHVTRPNITPTETEN